MSTSAKQIIDKFGGMRELAKKLGHKHPTTVQRWLESGHIPIKHHQTLFDLGLRLKIDIQPTDFLFVDARKVSHRGGKGAAA